MNLLTTIHNNGIVNRVQIVDNVNQPDNKTQTQLIWNGQIHCIVVGLNTDAAVYNEANVWLIKDFRAIYLDGIMIVKDGRVFPPRRPKWKFW